MPKIKPETKLLIIKSKSPAEVADIFNVSKQPVERIRKRYQETGDVHDRPKSGRPRTTTARNDSLLVRLTAPGGVDASGACFVKNCTSDSCSQWSPWSYCCPETSAKQETSKKSCWVHQGPQPDGRLDSRKLDFFQMNHQLSSIPSAANIVYDPQGPVWTHGSPRRQSNINRFLPPSTFPTTRGVRFFNRMELLAIPQVPP